MRPAILLLAPIAFCGLAAPSVGAQGPGPIASTRVTVVVPERPGARDDGEGTTTGSGSLPEWRFTTPASSRIDRPGCEEPLDLGPIGRASVSCLETVESAGGVAGVAIELDAERFQGSDGSERIVLELQLDQAATIRLPLQLYARGGRRVWRATLPPQAFLRIADARRISAHLPGASRILGASDRDALRRIAMLLDGAPVHPERARR